MLILLRCALIETFSIFFGPAYPVRLETRTRLVALPSYASAQYLNFTLRQLGPMTNNAADLISFERFNISKLVQLNAQLLSGYPDDWPHVEYLSAGGVSISNSSIVSDFLEMLLQYRPDGTIGISS